MREVGANLEEIQISSALEISKAQEDFELHRDRAISESRELEANFTTNPDEVPDTTTQESFGSHLSVNTATDTQGFVWLDDFSNPQLYLSTLGDERKPSGASYPNPYSSLETLPNSQSTSPQFNSYPSQQSNIYSSRPQEFVDPMASNQTSAFPSGYNNLSPEYSSNPQYINDGVPATSLPVAFNYGYEVSSYDTLSRRQSIATPSSAPTSTNFSESLPRGISIPSNLNTIPGAFNAQNYGLSLEEANVYIGSGHQQSYMVPPVSGGSTNIPMGNAERGLHRSNSSGGRLLRNETIQSYHAVDSQIATVPQSQQMPLQHPQQGISSLREDQNQPHHTQFQAYQQYNNYSNSQTPFNMYPPS